MLPVIFYISLMNLFFTADIQGDLAFLPEEEARHAVQVLRLREGATIYIIDGAGGWYECVIVETGKKRCVARVEHRERRQTNDGFHLHLAVAPTKNINRYEWLLEKATEIGIDEITPLLCFHSERRHLRADRLQKVLISAMKQSLKACLPQLNDLTKYEDFIIRESNQPGLHFIAHLGEGTKGHLKDNYRPGQSVTILIGPEGDFSEAEVRLALEHGFEAVTLGKSRLRTETAGVVACHIIQLLNS